MHPEPWPAAQHLPVIALAIVLCAALVTASLIGARLRLGQVREADTRRAQFDHFSGVSSRAGVRLSSLEVSRSDSEAAMASLTTRVTAIEARLASLDTSVALTTNGISAVAERVVSLDPHHPSLVIRGNLSVPGSLTSGPASSDDQRPLG